MSVELTARLRKLSVQAQIAGSSESKEACISNFLEEVEEVVNLITLEKLEDERLAIFYSGWLRWCTEGLNEQQRRLLLLESVVILPTLSSIADVQPDPPQDKVVSIFGG